VRPLLETDPAGGQVVVTRFECGSLPKLAAILLLHVRVKLDVRRQASGFLGIKLLIDWRHRTILSISLWKDLDSVYSMGNVPRHVAAVRVPGGMGVQTTCGVFCFVGDWRRVMFGGQCVTRSPLSDLQSEFSPPHVNGSQWKGGW
jgi:hypothetical protein